MSKRSYNRVIASSFVLLLLVAVGALALKQIMDDRDKQRKIDAFADTTQVYEEPDVDRGIEVVYTDELTELVELLAAEYTEMTNIGVALSLGRSDKSDDVIICRDDRTRDMLDEGSVEEVYPLASREGEGDRGDDILGVAACLLTGSDNEADARGFIEFCKSGTSADVWRKHGWRQTGE